MPLGKLSRQSIGKAIAEYDELGRDAFLSKHSFGRATQYALIVEGREYDRKAIAGVAYGFDHPDEGTLKNTEFNGGLQLRPAYQDAGYDVVLKTVPGQRQIGDLVDSFMESYPTARRSQFSGSAPVQDTLRSIVETLEQSGPLTVRAQVVVRGSAGQGNWAAAPWIAFLDKRETATTQRGVYPVLLFREDMSGVYLTLAQGTTELAREHGRGHMLQEMDATARFIRPMISQDLTSRGFIVGNGITLGAGGLARNYEASTIVHKLYEQGQIPDDSELLQDLDAVLELADTYIDAGAITSLPPRTPADVTLADIASAFRKSVDQSGLLIATGRGDRVKALVAALATKPFVILSGLSGSGKTQLALRLGEWFGAGPRVRRFLPVAVRPDWSGPEALFGYEDALRPKVDGRSAWFLPPTLDFMLAAAAEPDMPYLLLLDEMNLAHVERYFSDFLSGVESRDAVVPNLQRGADGEWREHSSEEQRIPVPRNLFVIGTVNVDETTYQFSPKVLDRATTFEIRTHTSELTVAPVRPAPVEPADVALLQAFVGFVLDDSWHVGEPTAAHVAPVLRRLHAELSLTDDEFGFRVYYESQRLAVALASLGVQNDEILDHLVLLKILPRIHGSRRRAEPVLQRLMDFAVNPEVPSTYDPSSDTTATLAMTMAKLRRMLRSGEINQFISFTD